MNIFRGRSPEERVQRVFGGQVAGQALVAACLDRARGPSGALPARVFHPARLRLRRCRSCTWWTGCETGGPSPPAGCPRSSTARRSSPCPRPSTIRSLASCTPTRCRTCRRRTRVQRTSDRLRRILGEAHAQVFQHPIELRSIGPLSVEVAADPSLRTTRNLVWLRVEGELPDDPLLHVCLMTYASDMTLLDSVLSGTACPGWTRYVGCEPGDHAMWFHRPFRADRWLLYAQDSPVAARGPGARRGVHRRG